MNRQQREKLAQETVAILEAGFYITPGEKKVSIAQDLQEACAGTVLYLPADYEALAGQIAKQPAGHTTTFHVSNRTALDAAYALQDKYSRVVALNFASAKNPGGGFLSGSQAQEESLARASGLYATLQTQPDFYSFHRQQPTCLYSDRAIYSPDVPVFRDAAGNLLVMPWKTSFLTAAAVNAGAVRRNEPGQMSEVSSVMQQRMRMILAIAVGQGYEVIVLGAWGCGVFQNEPAQIARLFASVLAEPLFKGRFTHIEFAVYDRSSGQEVYEAFERELG